MPSEKELYALISDSGRVSANFNFPQAIPIRPNPLKLSKWYTSEVSTINEQINSLEKSHSVSCTCKKGCSACCSQLIAVSSIEKVMMEFALSNLEQSIRLKIKDTTRAQCEILIENGFSSDRLFTNNNPSHETDLSMKIKFFSFNLQCPFLDAVNACLVYDIRPTVCWSYRNYGNPTDCNNSHNAPHAINYCDWENHLIVRLAQAKKPSKQKPLTILQFALQSILF